MNFTLIFENIIYWIQINYILSIILLFLFIFFYSLFSIPGLIFFLVFSGYSFGLFLPYFVCIISFTLGCFCFFILSKLFLNKFFQKYYIKYSSKVDKYIKNSTIEYLIIFRLVPGTPLFIQNTLLSLLKISNFKFLFSTFVGATPLTFFCIYIGNQLNNLISLNRLTTKDILSNEIIIILFILIILILIRIFYKNKLLINK